MWCNLVTQHPPNVGGAKPSYSAVWCRAGRVVNTCGRRANHASTRILYEQGFNLKLWCREVYYTNALILLVKIMLCSKLHCIRVFKSKLFSYKITMKSPLSNELGTDKPVDSGLSLRHCQDENFERCSLFARKRTVKTTSQKCESGPRRARI